MNIGQLLTCSVLAVAAATLPGCENDDGTIEQANSNTSWLTRCVADAECGSQFACLCGVCTRQCATESCDDLGGSCAEVASAPHALQCGGGDQVPICLRACTAEHAECGVDEACTAAGCVPRPVLDPCADASGSLVCTSFEQEDASVTQVVMDGGAIGLSQEHSLFGESALSASIVAGSGRSVLHYEFEPQTEGTLYLSAWLYVDAVDASALHFHALTVGSVASEQWGTTIHVLDGKLGLSFPESGDVEGELPVPGGRWFCVRAEIELDAAAGAASVWLDDSLSLSTQGVETLPPDNAHNIAVGVDYTTEPDLRLYVDALRLGTTPQGCTE